MFNKYGTYESNPLPQEFSQEDIPKEEYSWEDLKRSDKIEMVRLRLLGEIGFPLYDISYIWMEINGKVYNVYNFPYSQLHTKKWKSQIIDACKKQGVFVRSATDNVSILK